MDSTTWAALAAVLTLLGAVWTWTAYRRRGPAAGTRGLAWTLLPVAAYLTGTLKLAGNIAADVTDWASGLVFSPVVWAGIATGGVAAVLFVVSGWMLGRGVGVRGAVPRKKLEQATAPQVGAHRHDDAAEVDDEVADILRKHGIS